MIVVSLFDYTGNMVEPWRKAGYECHIFDIQHTGHWQSEVKPGLFLYEKNLDDDCLPELMRDLFGDRVKILFGFPPCTDLAVSGARWFAEKAKINPNFQLEAANLARQVERVGSVLGVPWIAENPVSRLSTLWRKPDYSFHPYEYSVYCEDDCYTKKTNLWVGGDFIMPQKNVSRSCIDPDDRIHKAPPSAERANFRSATPMGFAQAVFEANHV